MMRPISSVARGVLTSSSLLANQPSTASARLLSSLASASRSSGQSLLQTLNQRQRTQLNLVLRRLKSSDGAPKTSEGAAATSAASTTASSGTAANSGSAAADASRLAAEGTAKRGPVSWATLGLLLTIGAGALAYFNIKREEKKVQAQHKVETFGRPALGGPWSLVDAEGTPMTSGDLLGRFYLLYFGFTYCPDICPNELVKMGKVTDAVSKRAKAAGLPDVTPVFVTLDPYRDSCAQVGSYVKDFHPRMVGLTGTPAQLKKIAKSFRVYFQETDHAEGEEDYLVDHSIVMYLIGPNGDFLDFYTQMMTSPEISEKVLGTIAATMPPPVSGVEKLIKSLGFGK